MSNMTVERVTFTLLLEEVNEAVIHPTFKTAVWIVGGGHWNHHDETPGVSVTEEVASYHR